MSQRRAAKTMIKANSDAGTACFELIFIAVDAAAVAVLDPVADTAWKM